MKEKYLHVDRFPEAVFKLEKIDTEQNRFTGTLLLHGVEKPISGQFSKSGSQVKSEFKVKNSDFDIERPSFMGVSVEDEVQVLVELKLNEIN